MSWRDISRLYESPRHLRSAVENNEHKHEATDGPRQQQQTHLRLVMFPNHTVEEVAHFWYETKTLNIPLEFCIKVNLTSQILWNNKRKHHIEISPFLCLCWVKIEFCRSMVISAALFVDRFSPQAVLLQPIHLGNRSQCIIRSYWLLLITICRFCCHSNDIIWVGFLFSAFSLVW